MAARTGFALEGTLPQVASGKVRELYELDSETLLFVATDRISAYDVVMKNGIPHKGEILNLMSDFWLNFLTAHIPGLKTHKLATGQVIPGNVSQPLLESLQFRAMKVRKLKVLPLEAIVRGYITGSAWASYQKTGEVNGKKMPEGLQESQEFPQPLYTPSTKAELGQHDENITTEEAAKIVGEKYAKRIEELALQIFKTARAYAWQRGIIIADTKFEFGLDEETAEVVLIDEVLTPDSSRFWPRTEYQVGNSQNSFDKQYLRDWLTHNGLKGKQGVEMPEQVVEATKRKYLEAFEMITGESLDAAKKRLST